MDIQILPLTQDKFAEAVDVVLRAALDTKEEIEHHLQHIDAHFMATDEGKVIGVIGWYQDNVNYANAAMGDAFPGADAYWVGFFAVDKAYRGKGIGYALLQELEKAVKEKGAKKLWVSSVPETKDYYAREEFSLVKEGDINGHHKFFMAKNL